MHTPGPWIWCNAEANEHDCYVIAVDENDVLAISLSEPDARLIAAAPDLLAALRAIVHVSNQPLAADIKLNLIRVQARAAIAKAEGVS